MAQLLEQILTVSLYLILVPIGLGLYRWGSLAWPLRLFWLSLVFGFCITLAGDYLISRHINNHILFYINTVIDAALMTLFLTAFMPQPPLRLLFGLAAVGVAVYVGWSLWQHGVSMNGSLQVSSIETCLVVAMAAVVLVRLLGRAAGQPLRGQPVVYVVFGLLLANLLNLVLSFGGSQLYTYSAALFNLFWDTVAPLINLVYYVFVCIGFWKSRPSVGQLA